MTRDELLKDLKLNRITLRNAIKLTGPGCNTTNAMYRIASVLNELTIATLTSQERAEDIDPHLAPGMTVTHIPPAGKVFTPPGVTVSPLTPKNED